MILIFDLDDTLYNEIEYVESGFQAVSEFVFNEYKINSDETFNFMKDYLNKNGRGYIFNAMLKKYLIYSKNNVSKCISIYRGHKPKIKLSKNNINSLNNLKVKSSLYLVTDGNKIVQKNKIESLGIKYIFKKIFITHRYGIHNAKPSLYCFKKIKELEKCKWKDIFYIGDNPKKDFVNLNIVGANTVRILNGSFKKTKAKKGYDAIKTYQNIEEFFIDYV